MNRLRQMSIFILIGFIGAAGFFVWRSRHRRGGPVGGLNQLIVGMHAGRDVRSTRRPAHRGTRTHAPLVTGAVRWNKQLVAGATVEALGLPSSRLTTGASGTFSLALPADSTQTVRVTRPHAWTVQGTLVVGATNFDFESVDDSNRAHGFTSLGLTEDPRAGVIMVTFEPAYGRGYGARLSVDGGTRFVVTASGPRRQDTTTDVDNTLVIVNVPSGEVTVTPLPPRGACTPTFGTATVRVDPGVMTTVSFDCS